MSETTDSPVELRELFEGISRWECSACGKVGPPMLTRHATEAARWHGFLHVPVGRPETGGSA